MNATIRRPQDLVFSLFGEYLLEHPGPVWVGSLIELLAPLGLSEGTVRTVLSRMARKGWLVSERRGRTAWYDLTSRGRTLLRRGAERIYDRAPDESWDGSWYLVTYSIPEEDRELRDRFRVWLAWLGCGSLGGGVWISPHDVHDPIEEFVTELGIEQQVEVFRAQHMGFSDTRRLVASCWDLATVGRRYTRFIRRFDRPLLEDLAAKNSGTLSPEDAYVRRFELIHEYRQFLSLDPHLPRPLLPPDWGGECAAWLFEKYHDLLSDHADRYVDAVLASAPEPAMATV
jgi:phenylacetic acid degradation operon negative regulatory protein